MLRKQFHAFRVDFVFGWDNQHLRYLAVAAFSGLLNVITLLVLTHGFDVQGAKWYAVVIGGSVGYIGHKLVSYGYGEPFRWQTIPKFIIGVVTGTGVYAVVSWCLGYLFGFLPYLVIHLTTMVIGFLFFQQWNLRVTFRVRKIRSKSADSPAVVRVELSE